jgi:hypothetical protein
VSNNPGGGTRFAIHIPSTVFRERVLIADVGGALCALPARDVEAVVPIGDGMVESVGSTPLLRYRGEGIPFLPMPLFRGDADSKRAAIVMHSGRRWAISLPELVGDVSRCARRSTPRCPTARSPRRHLDDGRLVWWSASTLLSNPRQVAHLCAYRPTAAGAGCWSSTTRRSCATCSASCRASGSRSAPRRRRRRVAELRRPSGRPDRVRRRDAGDGWLRVAAPAARPRRPRPVSDATTMYGLVALRAPDSM